MPELVLADGSKQRQKLVGATRLVAPGCNATAIILALAPLVYQGVISPRDIVSTLAVGPSGAGRTLREDLLAAERLSSAMAYAVGGRHRHIPEIVQALSLAHETAAPATLTMTPVLVPMSRGILAVSTAVLEPGMAEHEVRGALQLSYHDEVFVELTEVDQFPASGSVLGSNAVAIGVAVDEGVGRVSVVSVIDNLVKGTAGQAVQSMNIALGLPETMGLAVDGVAP
jgi:N-acetyl-gamma-glutamyl-phosphate reductase